MVNSDRPVCSLCEHTRQSAGLSPTCTGTPYHDESGVGHVATAKSNRSDGPVKVLNEPGFKEVMDR